MATLRKARTLVSLLERLRSLPHLSSSFAGPHHIDADSDQPRCEL
jgi:hypothetical protein